MRSMNLSILTLTWFLLTGCQPAGLQTESIEGAWRARVYAMKSGESHSVDGTIFFSGNRWVVLFYVLDQSGGPTSGAAEGGTYTTSRNALTFSHLYNLSSGEAAGGSEATPLRMVLRAEGQGELEECTYEITGDHLTINFPSGNRMEFTRQT